MLWGQVGQQRGSLGAWQAVVQGEHPQLHGLKSNYHVQWLEKVVTLKTAPYYISLENSFFAEDGFSRLLLYVFPPLPGIIFSCSVSMMAVLYSWISTYQSMLVQSITRRNRAELKSNLKQQLVCNKWFHIRLYN